jgi:hypothetical protein
VSDLPGNLDLTAYRGSEFDFTVSSELDDAPEAINPSLVLARIYRNDTQQVVATFGVIAIDSTHIDLTLDGNSTDALPCNKKLSWDLLVDDVPWLAGNFYLETASSAS